MLPTRWRRQAHRFQEVSLLDWRAATTDETLALHPLEEAFLGGERLCHTTLQPEEVALGQSVPSSVEPPTEHLGCLWQDGEEALQVHGSSTVWMGGTCRDPNFWRIPSAAISSHMTSWTFA